jgi:Leucine-rich repeat (LRR) protein
LQRINSHETFNITKLIIRNCPKLEIVSIDNFNLQQLILDNLPKLNWLDCNKNNLTILDLTNCPNLQEINCSDNKLTQIRLPNKGEKLERLDLSNNNFDQELSFLSHLVNLKELYLGNRISLYYGIKENNKFKGSLETLRSLSKLECLDISSTDIDGGLEYLPESLKEFKCLVDERPNAKVKAIYDLFANEKGKVETDNYGRIKNFSQKLQDYKQ